MDRYDLIVIGSGAAGLSAAIYAGRYKMKTLVIGKDFGGETSRAGNIENYPGFKSIDGYELMSLMKEQAKSLGAEVTSAEVTNVSKDGGCFKVGTAKKEYKTLNVLFAVGSERRRLGKPNEKELTGKGVHFCITCDGPVYAGKTIAVVGGGDASVKGINLAAEYAKKIYFLVMDKKIIAEPINYEHMLKLGDKVETLLETQITEIVGKDKLEKVVLNREFNGSKDLVVDGLFVEIGAIPNVHLAKQLGVELDEKGFIKTDNMMKTNIPGVFAAGDTVNLFGRFKQDITASAMGAVAATSAYEYYQMNTDKCS